MNNLEKEINSLKKELLNMFLLVESQWKKSTIAILEFDQDIAEEISSIENRVNALELTIDKKCENILALLSPVAIDLRFVLSTYKINHELERVADIAESIANYVANNDEAYPKEVLENLQVNDMLNEFNSMIDDIIESFEEEDTKIARKIFKKDKRLNEYNQKAGKSIIKFFDTYNRENLMYLLSSIRKIERAGDSLKNIGEEIIFHLEAKVIKHKDKNT